MKILETIKKDITVAMKAKKAKELETLRFVWAELKNAEIEKREELRDEEVEQVIRKDIKKRRDAIEAFRKGGREELAREEEAKVGIIERYLPKQMSREEVERVVEEILSSEEQDFGRVMGKAMASMKGKADGKLVAEVVKEKIAS